ncbi:hypothetical protein AVEN_127280-1 [Araneus ventricosus]|uniref:Uncharacterized protein n=1 Tax=Araneus ventricosus TaxID=182803 RepID=A0A4Y2VPK1_ARAVE|nr:hypothetical protein AVEN_127280-1 [Araneus ventricosus]
MLGVAVWSGFYGLYYGSPGWVGFRTLTTDPNPTPNRSGGTRIDPYVTRASVSTLSWKNLLPNFIDSEVEEKVGKVKKFSSHHSLTNYKTRNRCLILKALQWVAEAGESLARNEILTEDEIIRTVTAEDDDDDDDVNPVNPAKFSHSEAVATLNTSLQWTEEKNFEAHEIMLLSRLRDLAF